MMLCGPLLILNHFGYNSHMDVREELMFGDDGVSADAGAETNPEAAAWLGHLKKAADSLEEKRVDGR